MTRDPRPAGNAPLILALIGAGIMIGINMKARAAELTQYTSHGWQEQHAARKPGQTYWPDDVTVEINQAGAPIDATDLIKRAAWSWSERTGLKMRFAGDTQSAGQPTSGRITVVWKTLAQIRYITGQPSAGGATDNWAYTDTGFIAGAIVYLPIDRLQCLETLILHELGHAIGIHGHEGAQPTDVMHATQLHCLPALTVQDVRMAPYSDHACHGEVLADGTVYLPAVEGWGVHLVPQGGAWTVARAAASDAVCSGARLTGDSLLLSDIRSPAGRWMGELRQDGNVWRVVWVAP